MTDQFMKAAERELAVRMIADHVSGADPLTPDELRRQLDKVTPADLLPLLAWQPRRTETLPR